MHKENLISSNLDVSVLHNSMEQFRYQETNSQMFPHYLTPGPQVFRLHKKRKEKAILKDGRTAGRQEGRQIDR
jgi:hypothetical protein